LGLTQQATAELLPGVLDVPTIISKRAVFVMNLHALWLRFLGESTAVCVLCKS